MFGLQEGLQVMLLLTLMTAGMHKMQFANWMVCVVTSALVEDNIPFFGSSFPFSTQYLSSFIDERSLDVLANSY